MKMHIAQMFLTLLALLALMASCAQASTNPKTITITARDNGRTIALQAGDQLVIALEGNPTTGYNWEAQPPLEGKILKQVGEPQLQKDSNRVGSGGSILLTFQAVADGQQDLSLVYHRSWEKNVPPEAAFQVHVTVSQ